MDIAIVARLLAYANCVLQSSTSSSTRTSSLLLLMVCRSSRKESFSGVFSIVWNPFLCLVVLFFCSAPLISTTSGTQSSFLDHFVLVGTFGPLLVSSNHILDIERSVFTLCSKAHFHSIGGFTTLLVSSSSSCVFSFGSISSSHLSSPSLPLLPVLSVSSAVEL